MDEIGASLQGGGSSSHRESFVEAQDSVPNNNNDGGMEQCEETLTSTQYLELTHAIDKLEA